MGIFVVAGAGLICPFGTLSGTLHVTSQAKCLAEGKPVATIQDIAPNANISSFGMCKSLANPQVASATAAALGVLTPQPCVFAPAGTWTPGNAKVTAGGIPCLGNDAKILCGVGAGIVQIASPGQMTVIG